MTGPATARGHGSPGRTGKPSRPGRHTDLGRECWQAHQLPCLGRRGQFQSELADDARGPLGKLEVGGELARALRAATALAVFDGLTAATDALRTLVASGAAALELLDAA